MYIAIARLEYRIHEAQSLKAKRHVVRQMLDRLRGRYRVSAAEVGYLDKWQRAALGVAVVGPDGPHVERVLSRIVQFLDGLHLAEPLGCQTEVMAFGGGTEGWGESNGTLAPHGGEPVFEDWPGLDGLDSLGEAAHRHRPFGDEDG
jgi:uncharacterized protein YlxP (DUF503 family)